MVKCPSCGTDSPDSKNFCGQCGQSLTGSSSGTGRLDPDTILEGRYVIVKTIGRGGMGAVYLALDTRLNNTPVAIKEMSTNAVGPGNLQAAIGAFKKEASILISLRHPALPRITDFFSRGEDRWYLVMDYIEGETLKQVVEKRGPIPEAEVVNWAKQLCEILDYLHNQNPPIIFRDLKPANIMLTPQGQIKLIDFGIARHFRQGSYADTAAYGSSGFAPPEQYGENQTGPYSDVYALGATLHYLLTGRDPSRTPFDFPPPSQLAEVSPRMETAIMKALELKVENRPASVMELAALLPEGSLKLPISVVVRPEKYDPKTLSAFEEDDRPKTTVTGKPYETRDFQDSPAPANGQFDEREEGVTVGIQSAATVPVKQAGFEPWLENEDAKSFLPPEEATEKKREKGPGEKLIFQEPPPKNEEKAVKKKKMMAIAVAAVLLMMGILGSLYYVQKLEQARSVDYDLLLGKAISAREKGDYKVSLNYCENAIKLDGENPKAYVEAGKTLYATRDFAKALNYYAKAIERSQNYSPAYYGRGLTYMKLEKYDLAVKDLTNAIMLDPENADAYSNRAYAYYELGQKEKAFNDYSHAINLAPDNSNNYLQRALVLDEMGLNQEALTDYNQAVKLAPNSAIAYNNRGVALANAGRVEEAIADFKKALQIDPSYKDAKTNLGALGVQGY